MFRDLFAIVVLLLAISPFTAPFQTCDAGYAIAVAAVSQDDEPGILVAPLVPKTSNGLIAPPTAISDAHQGWCAVSAPSRAVANLVYRPLIRPQILRI